MRTWIFLCLVAPTIAWAGDLDQAAKRFGSMQYEQALKLAQRSLKSPDNGPQEMVAGYRLEGLCLSALGRPEMALTSFGKLLAIEPGYRLKGDFSPKLTEPFQRAVAQAKQRGPIGLMHQPPSEPESFAGLELKVTLLSDPMKMVSSVRLTYFTDMGKPLRMFAKIKGPGEVRLKLPKLFKARSVGYFFEAANKYGGVLALSGSRAKPFRLETRVSVADASPEPPVLPVAQASRPRWEREEEQNRGAAFYETWWFWTVVGVVVAGAATGTALALTSGDSGGSVDYPIEWGVRP